MALPCPEVIGWGSSCGSGLPAQASSLQGAPRVGQSSFSDLPHPLCAQVLQTCNRPASPAWDPGCPVPSDQPRTASQPLGPSLSPCRLDSGVLSMCSSPGVVWTQEARARHCRRVAEDSVSVWQLGRLELAQIKV